MKHPSTRSLFDYWTERRGDRPAPARFDIDPAEIRHALGDTFMLAADFVDQLRFRLAGTRVCALFCREIKGEAFIELWDEASRKAVEELAHAVTGENEGFVAGLIGRGEDGREVGLEMLLLPLSHVGHGRIRALGVLAPFEPPYWLGETPVIALELATLRHVGAGADSLITPHFKHAPESARIRHGFVVYSGGRAPGERG
ncbi:PAS domain-containing protein [Pseudolabrys taiwanensis]|uniref:PAS domain-containing protein n=1 Tax=Pseudolabrys taiwanensis TaxID=331696 RepID=A0A345ZRC4_9HYPH|nr:PAS domain-containing protein [Pseudolabrys taiwanensis]AXK79471.1 PAS domain-containing protein [Pseudolabrys taiwanensis]